MYIYIYILTNRYIYVYTYVYICRRQMQRRLLEASEQDFRLYERKGVHHISPGEWAHEGAQGEDASIGDQPIYTASESTPKL